ncbi:DUF899 family protein [Fredinandcohnia sp. 179-A 10B2 NHS]|uniref:DUF899 family protein n=1 Tax=Fredinandcohnia sp. 179-A 10B2 NHS TaxID=3235176 RepID=UPI0039A0722F
MTDIQAKIEELEKELLEKKKELVQLRKSLPERKIENYSFITSTNEQVTLLELFGEKDELIIIHNMGKSCSYCTMWADGFNGVYHYLIAKAGFAVASPDTPEVQENFAAERKWQFPMISVKESSFTKDLGFIKENKYYYPGASTFRKDEHGNILIHAQATFGPGDDYCVPWHLFDLLPSGSEDVKTKRKLNEHSPFQLTNNIAVGVRNYEEALLFYKTVLGMKVEQTFDNETKFSISGSNFFFEKNEENYVSFEFAVDKIEEAKSILSQHGCKITREYSSTSIMIQDPFGLKFHLYESK